MSFLNKLLGLPTEDQDNNNLYMIMNKRAELIKPTEAHNRLVLNRIHEINFYGAIEEDKFVAVLK